MNSLQLIICMLACGFAGSVVVAADAPATAKPAAQPKSKDKPVAKDATPARNDQLTLDATLVTGNRELPKIMYIVPWKKADLSNLPGQPFNTLVDEVLAPVDREVFRREVDYYEVIADKDRAMTAPGGATTPTTDTK